ncbi:sensor histidine kinase [Clostridium estertheticum]|uniref:sensor histidine kinase n=1 Tax=Clostridium estertheticum TaxID=238834 RepID=UPI001C7CE74B|nr:GHKL domain-containing protein [Clostridium estertheticum]MBX4263772.1 ATP-binding protein [Clostridium estertheticum]WLC87586.1 ATP-binding protein [Clostridium estertheticum]
MMDIEFKVSAKTARLIGRENISEADGAIIELVKNGYDADAECIFVKYINPYNSIPNKISLSEMKEYFDLYEDQMINFYVIDNGVYKIKENLTQEELEELKIIVLSLSKIFVIDNGCGMTQEVLSSTWMNIGTDDKEINIYSKKNKRIKTGAKGIGRFALDKLSILSELYTKNIDDKDLRWKVNWSQFDDVKLLNQVKAQMDSSNVKFIDIVKSFTGLDYERIKEYDWNTGTAIVLSPIREFWNNRLYKKVNSNLQNINPLGSVDKFDIYVVNQYKPELNFESKSLGIKREIYDYKIHAFYDGKDKVTISLDRNEIDVKSKTISVKYSETDIETYDLEEFWNSIVFDKTKYIKSDFDKEVQFEYHLKELLVKEKEEDLKDYSRIGSFEMTIYYLKSMKSNVEIIKDFKPRERKQLLDTSSGVKVYRDNFKVRPYGDEGTYYDWINLSERVQKSPAAASHESGSWRVSPNQIVGSVSISRLENKELEDTANREGMNLNQTYYSFIKIIRGIFGKFEYDRQYPLREYATWLNEKKEVHNVKSQEVYEQVMRERENERKGSSKKTDESSKSHEKKEYSKEDYKEAIYSIGKKAQKELTINQLLMVLSSAGVMAQTFSHEISRVASNLGSRGQHLRECIKRMLDYKEYQGDEDFNPYEIIDELDNTDLLLADWVKLIMTSVEKGNFKSKEIDLICFLTNLKQRWDPLLEKKFIELKVECNCEDVTLKMPEVDLHLIFNNFLLNSSYFLEECFGSREIQIIVFKKADRLFINMKNNGPRLTERYIQNPDEILNAGISSKNEEDGKKVNEGTGLGLWIACEAVQRNYGQLHVIVEDKGFMLQASWKE